MPVGDIVQGYTFVPAEKGIDSIKMNAIAGQAYIAPAFVSGQVQSSSTTTGDYFLLYKANGTLAKILYDDLATSLGNSTGFQQTSWSVRLRSFNALGAGNPNFEVDQRTVGAGATYAPTSPFCLDRWVAFKVSTTTAVATAVQTLGATNVPGTNFAIGGWFLRTSLTTAQATLAAGDLLFLYQSIEGPFYRELVNDVHSVSILCRSSVANLSFGLSLRDSGSTRSLVKLCRLGAANTWTLISLPNLPIWAAGGGWTYAASSVGYVLAITLASGSTYISANDTWQTGNFVGAVGQSNFAASAVNSTFDLAFVQHEPGSQCTTLIDCPFSGQNGSLEACQRYYQKTYPYATLAGTANETGAVIIQVPANGWPWGYVPYKRVMAKVPTVTGYSGPGGAINNVRDRSAAVDRGISAVFLPGDSGFSGFNLASTNTSATTYSYHYTADTGL